MAEKYDERIEREECCPPRRSQRGLGSAIIGLGLLGLGVVLTLDNFHVLDARQWLPYWPVLLILLGLSHLLQPAAARRVAPGIAWCVLGGILLAGNLGLVTVHFWDLWPLVLVFVGGNLFWHVIHGRRVMSSEVADSFHTTAILGGVTRSISSPALAGGTATAMLGGCEIDLTGCEDGGGPAEIFTFALWGGVDIKVPKGWKVQVEGTAILGGFDDSTEPSGDTARKLLIVKGFAIMGGVDVKN